MVHDHLDHFASKELNDESSMAMDSLVPSMMNYDPSDV